MKSVSTESDYNESGLAGLNEHSQHFWFLYRNEIIEEYVAYIMNTLSKNKKDTLILELGAGSGNICRYLHEKGYHVCASDVYPSALKYFEADVECSFVFDLIKDEIPKNMKNNELASYLAELKHKKDLSDNKILLPVPL